jgi:hypothetical protein
MMNDKELEQETRAVLDLVEGLMKARATAEKSLAETLKLVHAANALEDQLRVRAAKLDTEVAASRTLARAGMLMHVAHVKTAEELKRKGECDCAMCSLRAAYTDGAGG